jgi:micrococcal nuclease
MIIAASLILCALPVAIDGDTLRGCKAGAPNLRLAGIDAPEMPGHCRAPRVCQPGNPNVSKAALQALISSGKLYYRVVAKDKYGRSVVQAFVNRRNVSCYMIKNGFAAYKLEWSGSYALC